MSDSVLVTEPSSAGLDPESAPGAPDLPRERSDADRKAMLAQSVANEVRKSWNVQSQNEFQAVMGKGKHTSHGLHVFLSIITFGLWIPVWVVVWYTNRDQHEVITVDPYGNVNLAK
jgi:hypothetical protein